MTPDGRRLRLATAQSPVTFDPAANGTSVRQLMHRAREQGARLVQFPEGALSGYPVRAPDWAALDREMRTVAALAAELRLWVVLGGAHRLAAPARPHNSLYVISDRGDLACRYDKRVCSHNELTNWYTPGTEPVVFEVDGFRLSCALCIEVNFPELFIDYADRNVDCVLFSAHSDDPIFETLARAHAASHNYWVGVSAPAHASPTLPAGVIGPHGYHLARFRADATTGLACADLDRADPDLDVALHRARPWRRSARANLTKGFR